MKQTDEEIEAHGKAIENAGEIKARWEVDTWDWDVPTLANRSHSVASGLLTLHERTEVAAKSARESRERIFVARGGHAWGKGFTVSQAVEAALGAGGHSYTAKKARKNLSVYKLPHGAYGVGVDEMGTIHWNLMWGGEGGEAEEIPEEEWM